MKRTTLRPVTCMQASLAVKPHPDGEFELDGQVLNNVSRVPTRSAGRDALQLSLVATSAFASQVSMVAVVRNVSDGASAWTYNLEDGTGSIDARLWKNKNDTETEEAPGVACVEHLVNVCPSH